MKEEMDERSTIRSNYIGLKKTLIWYLIGTVVIFWISALGATSDNPSPYYNELDTTPL